MRAEVTSRLANFWSSVWSLQLTAGGKAPRLWGWIRKAPGLVSHLGNMQSIESQSQTQLSDIATTLKHFVLDY